MRAAQLPLGLCAILAAVFLAAPAVLAHVIVTPAESPPGTTQLYTPAVPTETASNSVRLEVQFPRNLAVLQLQAPSGWSVTPETDAAVPHSATTTYVSAGDAGANNFGGFRHWVIGQARSRIFAFVHISNFGLAGYPVGEMLNIDYAYADLAAKTVAENADVVLGLKVRQSASIVGENANQPHQIVLSQV